ncbi:hypothetical protein ACWD25_18530 [Streptomyces sp. NPDC002920]
MFDLVEGASIGSVVPGAGTVVGGVVGALAGVALSSFANNAISDLW